MRKRRGDSGEQRVSVYDDISKLIDTEVGEVEQARDALRTEHQDALARADAEHTDAVAAADQAFRQAESAADIAYDAAQSPLIARLSSLADLRAQVAALAAQTESDPPTPDPTAPSAPEESAPSTGGSPSPQPSTDEPSTPSSDPSPTSAPTTPEPEPSTQPDEPSTPAPEPEPTTSSESGEPSPDPLPTASPDEAADVARGVDLSQPIAVPLTTGEVKVVTAGDVQAAKDPSIADEALTTMQLDLRRNSDWP